MLCVQKENAQLKSQLSMVDTGCAGQDAVSDKFSRRSGASGSVVTFQCGDQAAANAHHPATARSVSECAESQDTPAVVFRTSSGSEDEDRVSKGNTNRFSACSAASATSSSSQQGSASYQGSGAPPRASSTSSSLARHAGSSSRGSGGADRPSLSQQASCGSSARYSPSNPTASPPDSQRNSLYRETSGGSFSSIPLQQSGSDGGKRSPGKSSPSDSYSSFHNARKSSNGSLRSPSGGNGSVRSPSSSQIAQERQQLLSYEEAVQGSTGRDGDMELTRLTKSTSSSTDPPIDKSSNNHFVPGENNNSLCLDQSYCGALNTLAENPKLLARIHLLSRREWIRSL
jgi:hypothetical protein